MRRMFKSKIHRATVTDADLHYEGSVTLDPELLEASDIREYEAVHIWNVTRGTRLQTYALQGERGSRVCCVNGAAAHLMKKGDIVIISTFIDVAEEALADFKPTVVLVDADNNIVNPEAVEVPGPAVRGSLH
ncbi:MAG: aspartate 1-decarboxylase [Flavobacteriales bacterium]|jgi:aspartate 1-decarboxylase